MILFVTRCRPGQCATCNLWTYLAKPVWFAAVYASLNPKAMKQPGGCLVGSEIVLFLVHVLMQHAQISIESTSLPLCLSESFVLIHFTTLWGPVMSICPLEKGLGKQPSTVAKSTDSFLFKFISVNREHVSGFLQDHCLIPDNSYLSLI